VGFFNVRDGLADFNLAGCVADDGAPWDSESYLLENNYCGSSCLGSYKVSLSVDDC
jgi:hypothetical protein